MKIAMAQMSVTNNMNANYKRALKYIEKAAGNDLLFFPELMLTPFFPQLEKVNPNVALSRENDSRLQGMAYQAKKHGLIISPNVFLDQNGKHLCASLWFDKQGASHEIAAMIHTGNQPGFYEKNYYDPGESGFVVHDTPYGKVGIVIGYDRHFPESIRTCALKGAELIIVPAANTKAENAELYECELRTAAYQNGVFIALCNRVGKEWEAEYSGESMVADPYGKIIYKADDSERLIRCEIDLKEAKSARMIRPFTEERCPDMYER